MVKVRPTKHEYPLLQLSPSVALSCLSFPVEFVMNVVAFRVMDILAKIDEEISPKIPI